MKIRTQGKKLIDIEAITFCALAFDSLLKLSVTAPNLALDAVEVHTGRRIKVKLYDLDFEWALTKRFNL